MGQLGSNADPVVGVSESGDAIVLALVGELDLYNAPAVRKALEKWYGSDKAARVKVAESFEVCEYGRQPGDDDLRRLFPMLGK